MTKSPGGEKGPTYSKKKES